MFTAFRFLAARTFMTRCASPPTLAKSQSDIRGHSCSHRRQTDRRRPPTAWKSAIRHVGPALRRGAADGSHRSCLGEGDGARPPADKRAGCLSSATSILAARPKPGPPRTGSGPREWPARLAETGSDLRAATRTGPPPGPGRPSTLAPEYVPTGSPVGVVATARISLTMLGKTPTQVPPCTSPCCPPRPATIRRRSTWRPLARLRRPIAPAAVYQLGRPGAVQGFTGTRWSICK